MKTQMDKSVDEIATRIDFSGVISIRGDKGLQEKAYGYRDRSNKLENNSKTRFGIASGTKLFTALGIGKLIQNGKLSLDTKVFEEFDYGFNYSKEVTIEHLLSHTSGIPDYFDEDKITDYSDFHWFKLRDPKDYLKLFPLEEMKFQPGKGFSYCNGAYVLLADIISKVSGLSYHEFIKQNIFEPCDMEDSGFFFLNQLPTNTATGYIKDIHKDSFKSNIYNIPIIGGGDGGAYTTVDDIHKLWTKLFGYEILEEKLIKEFIKPRSITKNKCIYSGLGIWIDKSEEDTIYYIVGSDAGVSFKSSINLSNNMSYTVVSNTSNGAWPISAEIKKKSLIY